MVDIPNTFVPGEVASATKVNENFNALSSELTRVSETIISNEAAIDDLQINKADEKGNMNVSFDVGPAKSSTNAVNKGELLNMLGGLLDYISGLYLSKDTQSGNNSIIISKGFCYDTTHSVQISLNIDTSFNNTGQLANATYYVFLSVNEDGNNLKCLFNISDSVDGLDVDFYRCIGYYTTDNNNNILQMYSYGTNQSGMLDETVVHQQFQAMYPDLSVIKTSFPNAEWNSSTGQVTTIDRHYKMAKGQNWKISADGWVNWVCNENDTTRDLKIGESTDNMITVARVRAAASHDACGTAALIPICKNMYVYSSLGDIYFYPIRGV